jgi:hypothetical protein
MSWSLKFAGEVNAVGRDIDHYKPSFPIGEGESLALEATKDAIFAHLKLFEDGEGVLVEASGHDFGGKATTSMNIQSVTISSLPKLEQIITIDEQGKVHGDISGLKP